MMNPIELMDVHGCKVCGQDNEVLATLYEDGDTVVVIREPACSIGDYMYILSYLREIGFDVR